MKLQHLANQRIIISRMQAITPGSRNMVLSTVTAALGHLQPVGPEKASLVNGVFGKAYRLFVDNDVDLAEGDQLKDEAGNVYTVRKGGVTRWQHGAMDYQEVVIERT